MSNDVNEQVDVDDDFGDAIAQHEAEKSAKNSKGSGGNFDYEPIEWVGLKDKEDVVVRILGKPYTKRQSGSDVKKILFSKLVTDKGKHMHCIWDMNSEGKVNEDWLLARLHNTVMEKQWKKYEDGHKNEKGYDGEYVFVNKDKQCFKRIETNARKDEQYPEKFRWKEIVLFNVIDRMDSWCQENKHSKLLSAAKNKGKNPDDKGNPIWFVKIGVPQMLYGKILEDVVSFRKNWNLDIVIQKNSKDLNNAYIVRDIKEEKISATAKKVGTEKPLTEEESQYVLYDLDKLFKVSSYIKLKKNLIALFKMTDAELGTNFEEELNRLAAKEEKELAEKKAETAPVEEKKEVKIEEAKEEQKPRTRKKEEVVDLGGSCEKAFPKWNDLTDVEKKEMNKNIVSFSGNVPQYVKPKDALPCLNPDCKFVGSTVQTAFPDTILTCPVCGTKDESAA